MSEQVALSWMLRTASGGGAILLVAWWWMRRIESPARRQRLGEGALLAAFVVAGLGLLPAWITIPMPWVTATARPVEPRVLPPLPTQEVMLEEPFDPELFLAPAIVEIVETPAPPTEPSLSPGWNASTAILAAFASSALALLAWRLAGYVVVWWWLRSRVAIPVRLARVWESMPGTKGVRLIVSPRVRVPFSCGLWRPTVALPASMVRSVSEAELLWVLRHELRHLERRDPLSALLFGLGQSLFFYLPWYWWLRHEVRLCQEYLADQAAVEAGGDRIDYAGFLAGWAGASGVPAGAAAIHSQGSDLFRRIRMLLEKRSTLESNCPRRWLLATSAGLLSLAVLLAGVGPAAQADDKKTDPTQSKDTKKDDAPKKDDKKDKKDDTEKPKDGSGFPDIDELLKKLPGNLDERQLKMIRQQLEAARRQMEQALKMGERLGPLYDRMPIRPVEGLFGRPGTENRLGAKVVAPSSALTEQLDLPKGQGLVVEDVTKDSPASKAGLKTNDVLLELAGKAVSNRPAELAKQVDGLESNKAVDVVVLRKGKKETLKGLTVPEAKPIRGGVLGSTSMLNLSRSGDSFTLYQREGTKSIQMRGKLRDGKAESVSITIADGRQSNTYDSVDKVPEAMRDEVKGLLALCEKKVAK